MYALLFLIPLMPFLGAAVLFLFGKNWSRNAVHGVTILAMAVALAQSLVLFFQRLPAVVEEGGLHQLVWSWIHSGDLKVEFALRMDALSGLLCLVVTGIGTLIHIYSWGYMAHDRDYRRFFAYLNLFCGAMLTLVLGDSLPVMFVGWEGVGLCSYLLIGFWYTHGPNADAGKKAFITNRVGDFAFILGMFLVYQTAGTLNFREITQAATPGGPFTTLWHGMPVAFWIGLLLFIGACGKSAQIPLYVWLPDAMAGPTPVSALIHAATMVTAGVYMVARLHAVYILSPAVMAIVAVVGALTALFAAAIGFAQNDFKKVLAYSTVSQLGFMFAGVGTGNFQGGIFHLFTHAFFKAGLFLCAGSVMHAMSGSGDITKMGGLRKRVPRTWLVFLVCWLAICGVPPFAGFFSKDAIIAGAFATEVYGEPLHVVGKLVGVILMLAALGTAFYMSRLYYLVFSGDEPRCDEETRHHIHESPGEMVGPLLVLGAGAVLTGVVLCFPGGLLHHPTWNLLGHWLEPAVGPEVEVGAGLEVGMMVASFGIALVGIFAARAIYRGGFGAPAEKFAAAFPALLKLAQDKFRVDELYAFLFIRPLRRLSKALFSVVDRVLIDRVMVGIGPALADTAGRIVRTFQSGDLQSYLAAFALGVALLVHFASQPTPWPAPRLKVEVSGTSARIDASPAKATGRELLYRFDCQNDGTWEQEGRDSIVSCPYAEPGRYTVRVRIEDKRWQTKDVFTQKVEIK